jgi:hypothetical protein
VPFLNTALLALVVIAYVVESTHYVNGATLRVAENSNYPRGAIAYLRTHQERPRVFASYAWGGYLLWNLFPRYRDFMDSRADTLYHTRILDQYLSVYAAGPQWKSILNSYRVDGVLVERGAPIAQVLAENRGWRLAYHDDLAVLYVRR